MQGILLILPFLLLLAFVPLSLYATDQPGSRIPQSTTPQSESSPGFQEAMRLYRAGRFAEAGQHFEALVKMEPRNAAAYYFWGYSDYVTGHHQEAADAFSKVFAIDPKFDPRPYFRNDSP